jgi:predicted dehydrogenase
VVAVLGPGRPGETHVAALRRLQQRALDIEDRRVSVVPALYGRNADKVRAVAERREVERTSTDLAKLIEADNVAVVDNCPSNRLHFGPRRARALSDRSVAERREVRPEEIPLEAGRPTSVIFSSSS